MVWVVARTNSTCFRENELITKASKVLSNLTNLVISEVSCDKLFLNMMLNRLSHPMLVKIDTRKDYGEQRLIGLGKLDGAVVVIVFTKRSNVTRIISQEGKSK